MKKLAKIVVVVLASGPASADVTVCRGDSCTIEENGTVRVMSPKEVGKTKRENARTALGNIECRHAVSPDACENLMRDLFAQFPN